MKQQKPPKGAKKQAFSKIVMLLVFLIGLLVMTYPFYSNALNNYFDQQRLEQVQQENQMKSHELAKKAKEEMHKRNATLAANGLVPSADPFDDNVEKKIISDEYASEHLIGAVSIPAIRITIPLFDLTNDQLLQIGATVLQGTSYPTGGPNTHSVISAHSGLPERKLFTDLEEVEEGDIFVLTVFEEKLAYQVENTQIVKPNDTSTLKIEFDRDLATLLTCTPYMINSHRLLVTGHRVPYSEDIAKQLEKADRERKIQDTLIVTGISIGIVTLLFGIYRIIYGYLLKKRFMNLIIERVNESGKPIKGVNFSLYNRSGKKAFVRDQMPLQRKSDGSGRVVFEKLPAGIYSINEAGSKERIKVGIKKRKQFEPRAYPTKRQKRSVTNQYGKIQIKK